MISGAHVVVYSRNAEDRPFSRVETMSKRLALLLGFLLTWSVACAQVNAPRTYKADGKVIGYKLTVFNPPIPVRADPARMNQDSAVNCSILFMTRLHDGDIAGAAAVTSDPEATIKTYTDYKARVGEGEFKKQMAGIFQDDQYRYELVDGPEHVLVTEKNPDQAGAVVEKNGKFWMDRSKLPARSKEFMDLFKLVNDHAAGKLEFK